MQRKFTFQGHYPRRRFSQIFLTDATVIAEIANSITVQKTDAVVEIGPGLGALTEVLLEKIARIYAVEIDHDLAQKLQQRWPDRVKLQINDALQVDFQKWPEHENRLRFVGNLPYKISGPFLYHLLSAIDRIQDQHFMLQKEVVQRLVAQPHSCAYGRLSVLMQAYYDLESLFEVPKTAFFPIPSVTSAIIRMRPKKEREIFQQQSLILVTRTAFAHRRKTLRYAFDKRWQNKIDFQALGLSLNQRAEEVSVAEYIRLSQVVDSIQPHLLT